jgi:hypothetical protein
VVHLGRPVRRCLAPRTKAIVPVDRTANPDDALEAIAVGMA